MSVSPTLYIEMHAKDVGELNKAKILQCLASGDIDGKSTTSITNETGLHRDTIHTLSRQLIATGLVTKGQGRWGKYRLTEKALGDVSLLGWIFGRSAFKEIWRKGSEILSGCQYCNNVDLNDAAKISDEEFERRLLFSFTVLIGAYVMFVFLRSFEPSAIKAANNTKKSFRTPLQKVSGGISGRHKDELVRQWVNSAIQPYMMLTEFRKLRLIRRNLKRYEGGAAASTDMSWGFNVMSEENYKRLMLQFVDIFKGLHGVLEKEMEKAPSTRDWYRRHRSESVAGAAVTAKEKEGTVDGTSTDNNMMTSNNNNNL
jgi:hypothetical protein